MNKLVLEIYKTTNRFPEEEHGFTGIVSQLRRASISAVSNIAEGSSRENRELVHFLKMSLGSLREMDAQIEISCDLKYITEKEKLNLCETIDECTAKLINYMKKIKENMNLI